MVAVRIGLRLVSELRPATPRFARCSTRSESVEAAIEELREVAHGIYPQVLSDHGLVAALRHVSRAAGGSVTVRGTGVSRHPAELESAIYYCCREAIQNASKHGGPPVQISISLHEDTRNVGFEEPDGPGFDLAEASPGAGLQHMRDRPGALGGCLSIVSPAGVAPSSQVRFRAGEETVF